ncbi:hypothetical protein Nepgr_031345 [Nepenthes gracilis]|uniref:Uncharacterized protein n=1 Tax=Nepenthes gracilis TaxID=150966 RepID=A0AAD3Y4Q3_NEPGR|nr:hypothetical protein Nepgr_031345 [Nepenthes gracilis]
MAVSANPYYDRHDPSSALGMPSASGKQEGQAQSVAVVLSCGNHHLEDKHKEWHHDSYVEVLRCGITVDGTGYLDAGCRFSLKLFSPHCPSHPQGGDPRQFTYTEQLRRNLAGMRQKDAAPGAQVADAAFSSLVSGRDTFAEGFRLKSILKKPKRPK